MFVPNIVLQNTKSYQAVEYTLQYIDTRIENMMYMVHIEKTTIEWKIVCSYCTVYIQPALCQQCQNRKRYSTQC